MSEHHDWTWMESHRPGYGPLKTFEITWMSGHVERIQGHQISWPGSAAAIFGAPTGPSRVAIHAELDGQWTLQLSAREDDIRTIRNLATEDALLEDQP